MSNDIKLSSKLVLVFFDNSKLFVTSKIYNKPSPNILTVSSFMKGAICSLDTINSVLFFDINSFPPIIFFLFMILIMFSYSSSLSASSTRSPIVKSCQGSCANILKIIYFIPISSKNTLLSSIIYNTLTYKKQLKIKSN